MRAAPSGSRRSAVCVRLVHHRPELGGERRQERLLPFLLDEAVLHLDATGRLARGVPWDLQSDLSHQEPVRQDHASGGGDAGLYLSLHGQRGGPAMVTRTIYVLLFALGFASLASAKIWVVAADGSGDFTRIQSAVNAAVDGDVIVVREGFYDREFEIEGKQISLIGSGPGRTVVTGITYRAGYITKIPVGGRVLLGHMTLSGV